MGGASLGSELLPRAPHRERQQTGFHRTCAGRCHSSHVTGRVPRATVPQRATSLLRGASCGDVGQGKARKQQSMPGGGELSEQWVRLRGPGSPDTTLGRRKEEFTAMGVGWPGAEKDEARELLRGDSSQPRRAGQWTVYWECFWGDPGPERSSHQLLTSHSLQLTPDHVCPLPSCPSASDPPGLPTVSFPGTACPRLPPTFPLDCPSKHHLLPPLLFPEVPVRRLDLSSAAHPEPHPGHGHPRVPHTEAQAQARCSAGPPHQCQLRGPGLSVLASEGAAMHWPSVNKVGSHSSLP